MKVKASWKKITYAAVAVGLGVVAAYYGQPLIHGNDQAINVIVTVFSILAGFLVAIIAVIGDTGLIPEGSWRVAEFALQLLKRRLARHKWLFFLYLVTLGIIFVSLLADARYPQVTVWLERCYLFVATVAFLLSLRLPWALAKIQEERIEKIHRKRREAAGLGD